MPIQSKSAELKVQGKTYKYYPLEQAARWGDVDRLPKSLKVLLENLLRNWDGEAVTEDDISALAQWTKTGSADQEIAFLPARVLMQDFTGVPGVVDLAAMREAVAELGGNPEKINPLSPVDLVIDHSVMVDYFGSNSAFEKNVDTEMERNFERYEFLKWGQKAFKNFRVVPPGTGICHQVNLEYLGQTVWVSDEGGTLVAYPDTLVGTDSHTTMINGLSVLGWGVGGIEAEAAMLGQPISMLIPEVIGFKLTGKLKEGRTATDLVLTVTQMLRKKGVVGKFVEFYGDGIKNLGLSDRATIANMSPEYGATCGFFPIDGETIRYLSFTGRSPERVALVEAYAKAQGLWRHDDEKDPIFSDTLELDLSTVEPSLAGPKRPQDRLELGEISGSFTKALKDEAGRDLPKSQAVPGKDWQMQDGSIVIAAITSCTNTSNPAVMLAAGLLAKKAVQKGLKTQPWVKTSLAPGSQVVTEYYKAAGVTEYLDALGFNLVGYGCTTCIGNSGPLSPEVTEAVEKGNLVVASVLSGNRNFEGRINPLVRANYLASPPLVVAYALAGHTNVNLERDPLGKDKDGNPVYLKDIWPSQAEVREAMDKMTPHMFADRYSDVFQGPKSWQDIPVEGSNLYRWQDDSTYIKKPSFFDGMTAQPQPLQDIKGARILALLGDSITTDHISPAGSIKEDSPAGAWLKDHGVERKDFNSFGSRRGNHEVMVRGTFGNIRLKNEMVPDKSGGWTMQYPEKRVTSIYEASEAYRKQGLPLVVFAGTEYGTGSSRDWAAKGTNLLGVRAVIAESFERIHRSNLVGMGVLPLEFINGENRKSWNLTGAEFISILDVDKKLGPKAKLNVEVTYEGGEKKTYQVVARVDTGKEMEYFRHGGILHSVIRRLVQ